MNLAWRKIPHSFGQASKTYDKHAVMQVVAANQLVEILPSNLGDVCEIGCGTGIMTHRIMDIGPSSLIISDISPEMLAVTMRKFPTAIPTVIDAQYFPVQKTNTIISNMALQWSNDLLGTIRKLINSCDNLFFSLPLASSMPEWNSFCKNNNIANCLQPLPKLEDVKSVVPSSHYITCTKNSFCLYYASWLTFWNSQKKLGAHISNNKISELYKVRRKLTNGPIKITYENCCIAIRRK